MRTPEELREMARVRYGRRRARLEADPKLMEAQRAKDRERWRKARAAKVLAASREESRRLGPDAPARMCGFTKRPCPKAFDCAWNAAELARARGSDRPKRIDACAFSVNRGVFDCAACPARRRCEEVWRCFKTGRGFETGTRKRGKTRFEGGLAPRTGKDAPKGRGAICNGVATGLRGRPAPSDERQVTSDKWTVA